MNESINIFRNLQPASLVARTVAAGQGTLTPQGALAIDTGRFKGRSPQDRFIVKDEITAGQVWWNDQHNFPLDSHVFDRLYYKMETYLSMQCAYTRYALAGADPRYQIAIEVTNEYAWSDLFVHNMFIRPTETQLVGFVPDWRLLCAPGFQADPTTDAVPRANFTILNFKKKTILIGGTGFTGEIKKSVFTVLNFLLPLEHHILPMHCGANVGEKGDTALFFGLSGTGKTTLSAVNDRMLIGDDEHGWSDTTIFNFEGGCYARTIHLTRESEPRIFDAIKFAALLENIGFQSDGVTPDYHCDKKTPNARVSYPLPHAGNILSPSVGGIPKNIFFLTADAFGVLPPISRLTDEQAAYYFLSGYSAKIPGSEVGVTTPTAVFSPCFGAPFFLLHPMRYADLLREKLKNNAITTWLVNTGWIAGGFGVGKRISLEYSRAIIKAVLDGALDQVPFDTDNIFALAIPTSCPGVPAALLHPADGWQDKEAYHRQATALIEQFRQNHMKYQA